MIWRHTVYIGIFSVARVFEILQDVLRFDPDPDSLDAFPPGESALAAFAVSADSLMLSESDVLSSCGWAVGRSLRPGLRSPRWLDGWERAQEDFRLRLQDIVAASETASSSVDPPEPGSPIGEPLTFQTLSGCLRAVVGLLGVDGHLECNEIRIRSVKVRRASATKVDSSDFLNSFIAEDLGRVATSIRNGAYGQGLFDYLREDGDIDTAARVDLQCRLDVAYEQASPQRVPLGRWPSAATHPLALGQQLAVNTLMTGNGATFAVNGPPGTGKTTMLRDLIAAIVVERANQLADLKTPTDAFAGATTWQTGDYRRTVQIWQDRLTGFEMVVASSNNGAVQNVTDEIPGRGAIDESWHDRLDYFPDIATALLNVEEVDEDEQSALDRAESQGAWALVAARLGNKPNRSRFVSGFWFDEQPSQRRFNDGTNASRAGLEPARLGMQSILKALESKPSPRSWDAAVLEYKAAQSRASDAQRERAAIHTTFAKIAETDDERLRSHENADAADRNAAGARQRVTEHDRMLRASQSALDSALARRRQHRDFRPNFIESLFTLGRRMREWSAADEELAKSVAAQENLVSESQADLATETASEQRATQCALRYRALERAAVSALTEMRCEEEAARSRWRQFVPDSRWWGQARAERAQRELAALWIDAEWNTLRTELFLAALRLHKAFLAAVPKQMRQSLHGAMDILSGAAPRDVSPDAARAAWQSLFFVVPVVSTTFASYARVFGHLGPAALGWLFIDEAGQATPQNAVGAIWRSRRAVVVGDPLQLEPIVTLPFRAQEALRDLYDVTDKWTPGSTSVQTVADQLNPLGTSIQLDDKEIWVGAPLRVHRRCDEPMFTVVNEIAYEGRMIQGTARRRPFAFPNTGQELPSSQWIDVVSADAQGHWIPDEGKALGHILDALRAGGQTFSEVFVISPFRDVAAALPGIVRQYSRAIESGTIHTAQGKEADIVILVLGGSPKKDGAKGWAASKPNLVNVAVSRARRRIYVIGNYSSWHGHRYFSTLAAHVDRTVGSSFSNRDSRTNFS